jgi:peptide/nickel transport system ATP-binding protein
MGSQDLAVIDHMCERIMVMRHGRAVEEMTREDLANARMNIVYARSLFDASADRMPDGPAYAAG